MKENKIPRSISPIFETHVHLDYLKKNEMVDVIQKSEDVGVDKFITMSCSPDNQDTVLSIAGRFDNVWCTQGIHPHDARLWDLKTRETILRNVESDKVKAIGEIGLDYHYDNSPRDIQRKVFDEQLQIASDQNLPVIVHTREAEDDTISVLKNHLGKIKKIEIHCFTSSMQMAEFALGNGFYLGFNGIITFKPAENVREILRITPPEQILLETDAPFLAPNPVRGKENAPFYLPFISKRVAEIKETSEEKLLPIIYQNSMSFFEITL
ncbi:MAG: TatD family hydrolase [Bacteriovoracaceae bacterium]|nr:TatD family hydrolase [Bacteriovoracaceae bacterium]